MPTACSSPSITSSATRMPTEALDRMIAANPTVRELKRLRVDTKADVLGIDDAGKATKNEAYELRWTSMHHAPICWRRQS